MDFIILAGGKGTRLPEHQPKILAPVNGEPFLRHLLASLPKNSRITLALGHEGLKVVEYVKAMNIGCFVEPKPLGTGGAIRACMNFVHHESDPVIVINGDTICKVDWIDLLEAHDGNVTVVTHKGTPAGVYVMNRSFIDGFPRIAPLSLEEMLALRESVNTFECAGFYDIGTPDRLKHYEDNCQ